MVDMVDAKKNYGKGKNTDVALEPAILSFVDLVLYIAGRSCFV